MIEQALARASLKLAPILNLEQQKVKIVTLQNGRVPKLKEVTFKYRIPYIIYEPIIVILDNIKIVNTHVFLGISIVNTIFSLNNYYLSDLIVILNSISSIMNRDAYKRWSYTFTTNDYLYIIRLNLGISVTIYTEDRNDYNLIYYNY